MRSILLLPLVARCLETCLYVCCSDGLWYVGMFVVLRPLLRIAGFSLAVLKYVVCLCKGCDRFCVFCLYCEAWRCKCSCMVNI